MYNNLLPSLREDLIIYDKYGSKCLFDPRLGIEYSVNPVGFEILLDLCFERDYSALLQKLANKYSTSPDLMDKDINSFFRTLNANFLTENSIKNSNILLVKWHITDACNLRCRHCYMNSKPLHQIRPETELTKEQKILVVDKLFSYADFCHLHLSGGEVFLCPDFFDIIEHVPSDKGTVTFFTNGTLINKYLKKIDEIDREKIDTIYISLLGISDSTQKSIRGVGVKKITSGIQSLIKMGFNTEVSLNVWKNNLAEMEDAVKLCIDLGVKGITFHIIENKGRADSNMRNDEFLNPQQRIEFLNIIKHLEDDYGKQIIIKNTLDSVHDLRRKTECLDILSKIGYSCNAFDPWKLQINPKGNIHLCYEMGLITDEFYVGNIITDGVKDIMLKKEEKIRLANSIKRQCCKECELFAACKGSCLVQVVRKNTEFFSRNCLRSVFENSFNISNLNFP